MRVVSGRASTNANDAEVSSPPPPAERSKPPGRRRSSTFVSRAMKPVGGATCPTLGSKRIGKFVIDAAVPRDCAATRAAGKHVRKIATRYSRRQEPDKPEGMGGSG